MPRKLDPLPKPPASFKSVALPIFNTDQTFIRIHQLGYDPAYWGLTGNNRFDAPNREYRVLYAVETFDGAFIETFGDLSPKIVSVNSLTARGAAAVSPKRALKLVDLAGAGLSQLGLDARICTDDHALSQEWSYALWSHPAQPDGIWYVARHDASQRSVALFERTAAILAVTALGGLMEVPQKASTARAVEKYSFTLFP